MLLKFILFSYIYIYIYINSNRLDILASEKLLLG